MTASQIVAKTASVFGVDPNDIRSKSKLRRNSLARTAAIFAMHNNSMCISSIAREFKFDRSAIYAHVEKAEKRMEMDPEWAELYRKIVDA